MANEAVEMEPSGRVLPIFRGEYDAGRTYENPDIVLYRNSSYVAKQVTVGNPPPAHALADDYWQMVARGIIDADVSESTVEFEEAKERANIKSGEKSNVIMGKIMKFFTDLKYIAFSGSYSDLIDAPISLKNPKALTFTGAVTGSYDGSTAKSVAIPSVGNGTLTIQKNGTNIKTFSANQTGNVTANITVPTSASDVSAVPASKVLTTAEQINANTNSANVAGATAVKAMVNQINSNLPAASWGNVTVNTNVVSNGAIQYQKYGNICIVYFAGNVSTTNVWTDYKLASRLPPVKYGYIPMGIFQHQDTQKAYIATVAQEELYIRTENEPPSGWMRGSITYVCN